MTPDPLHQLLQSDRETRPRRPSEPAAEQETPRSATDEPRCRLDPGNRLLAVQVQSEEQDPHGVPDDWTLVEEPP